jgi:hypothetical protein
MEAGGNEIKKGEGRSGFLLVVVALLFLFTGIYTGSRYRDQPYTRKDVRKFEKTLHPEGGVQHTLPPVYRDPSNGNIE